MLKEKLHKTPEYTKINPFQVVPAITDNGIPIIESCAILRYLAFTRDVDDHWYPKNPLLQSKVTSYLDWQHLNTRWNCARYFQVSWLIPMMTQEPIDKTAQGTFLSQMENTLKDIEQIWLEGGKRKYIAGPDGEGAISVADIMACCELEQPSMAGYDVRKGRPILEEYMNRVKEDLNPHYDDVHKVVYMMTKKFRGQVPKINKDKDYKVKF
jgi:glutathione S-transferase